MLAAGGSEAYGNEMMKMTELAHVARIDTDSKIDQIDAGMKMTIVARDQRDADTDSKIDQIDADMKMTQDTDSKIMDYTDTDFTTACNMLPNIVALPVCV